jgi:hypothetical protein
MKNILKINHYHTFKYYDAITCFLGQMYNRHVVEVRYRIQNYQTISLHLSFEIKFIIDIIVWIVLPYIIPFNLRKEICCIYYYILDW